jgi:hypothetical protein
MPAAKGKADPAAQIATGASPVRFQLRITNYQNKDVKLLAAVGQLLLRAADGQEFKVHPAGAKHLRVPQYVTLAARKTTTIKGSANFSTGGPYGTCLWWEDEFGTNWYIKGLKPGDYTLRLRYDTRRLAEGNDFMLKSGAWLGDVRTAEVPIKIIELQASAPAVVSGVEARSLADGTWQLKKAADMGWKDDVEVTALVEATWKAPAAGRATPVGLGYRMATVEKWWVRIIPGLAAVSLRSTDGVELPVKKTTAKVTQVAPPLLALRPEFSHTVAIPAALARDGKTLTLAWADATGQVWHVENLKPGRYAVRYHLRAEKGEPSQFISYWVGDIRTPPVMIEIKE